MGGRSEIACGLPRHLAEKGLGRGMARQTGSQAAEAVVVGAGPAGLTAAIALAIGGIETVLVAKRQERPDTRTSALLAGSVAALDVLGVWDACRAHAAPLRVMRLADDTQ